MLLDDQMNKEIIKLKDLVYLTSFYLILDQLSEMTTFYPSLYQEPYGWLLHLSVMVVASAPIDQQKQIAGLD